MGFCLLKAIKDLAKCMPNLILVHNISVVAMLKWFVDSEVAFQVQRNRVLIEEEQVEV